MCTFPECALENYLFDSIDAWFSHEAQTHRVELFCRTPGHDPFTSRELFLRHLSHEHNFAVEPLAEDLQVFQRSVQLSHGSCNLCHSPTGNMKRHVSRHLRQISLFSIPRGDYQSPEDDDGDSARAIQCRTATSSSSSSDKSSRAFLQVSEVDEDGDRESLLNLGLSESAREPVPTIGTVSWENVQTYGVLDARQGISDQPPEAFAITAAAESKPKPHHAIPGSQGSYTLHVNGNSRVSLSPQLQLEAYWRQLSNG